MKFGTGKVRENFGLWKGNVEKSGTKISESAQMTSHRTQPIGGIIVQTPASHVDIFCCLPLRPTS
jgi:hypothetical protein